jgi:hypothetical protein
MGFGSKVNRRGKAEWCVKRMKGERDFKGFGAL